MPFVNIRTARGILDEAAKYELHRRITDLLVEIEGRGNPDFRPLVSVLIEEHDPAAWSLGGVQVDESRLRASSSGVTEGAGSDPG